MFVMLMPFPKIKVHLNKWAANAPQHAKNETLSEMQHNVHSCIASLCKTGMLPICIGSYIQNKLRRNAATRVMLLHRKSVNGPKIK